MARISWLEQSPCGSNPLTEQCIIVWRVGRLLARITERKAQADALMQAVLRKAFAISP